MSRAGVFSRRSTSAPVCAHLHFLVLYSLAATSTLPPASTHSLSTGTHPFSGVVEGPGLAAGLARAVTDVCEESVKLGDLRTERRSSFEAGGERVKQGSPIIVAISALFVYEASWA